MSSLAAKDVKMGVVGDRGLPEERGLVETIYLVRDGWAALIAFLCAGVAIGILATLTQPTTYRATATGVVSPANGFLNPTNAAALPAVSATVSKLATTPAVLMKAAGLYGELAATPHAAAERLHVATPAWLRSNVSVAADATSSILTISTTAASQMEAVQLASAVGQSLAAVVNDTAQSSGGAGIDVRVFAPPAANGKISPTPLRNVLIGADAGLIVGIVAALALGARRRKLRRPEDVAAALGAPLIGSVRAATTGHGRLDPGFAEARARLQTVADKSKCRVFLVTGTLKEFDLAGIAVDLARSLATASSRVLVVDADLSYGAASGMLVNHNDRGLVDALRGNDPASLIVSVSGEFDHRRRLELGHRVARGRDPNLVRGSGVAAADETEPLAPYIVVASTGLYVLPAGSGAEDPASMVGRDTLGDCIAALRMSWDFIVMSGPPVDRVAEVISLTRAADYVVLVAAVGARDRELRRARAITSETADAGAMIVGSPHPAR